MAKLYSVQFLRFFAAICVANHHYLYTFSVATDQKQTFISGAYGVEVFFVISGLVIGLCLVSESFYEFAIRRIIRIFPILILGTLFYVFAMRWAGAPLAERGLLDYIHSILLWPSRDPDWLPAYGPAWTLQYELGFYLFVSILLALLPRDGNTRLYSTVIGLSIIGVTPITRLTFGGDAGYYKTSLLLLFVVGVLLSTSIHTIRKLPVFIGFVSLFAALALFAFQSPTSLFDPSVPNQQARSLSIGMPASLLVFSLINFDHLSVWKNRVLMLLGDASYVIYMTHLGIIQLVFYYGLVHGYTMKQYPIAFFVVANVFMIGFGVVIHLVIEKPILRFLRKKLT
jgi:exopolysaccharide production protein ExoZ